MNNKDKLVDALVKLLNVKSIISLIACGVFALLAVNGKLSVENSMVLLTMVFQSFFSYQNSKKQVNVGVDENAKSE